MTDLQMERVPSARRTANGPNPGAVTLVALVLTLAGLAIAAALSGGAALGSPFTSSTELLARLRGDWPATRASAWLQVGSAIPLGIAAATFYARQQHLGVRVPGAAISFFGGILATGMLMVSGCVEWVLSRVEILTDASLVQALAYLAFIAGGVSFVLGVGLLVAGIAVPALVLRLLPRWLAVAGLVIAVCCEVGFVAMVVEPLQVLLPFGRFLGLLWLVVAGFLLPTRRRAA